jgi:hypothetical protein
MYANYVISPFTKFLIFSFKTSSLTTQKKELENLVFPFLIFVSCFIALARISRALDNPA